MIDQQSSRQTINEPEQKAVAPQFIKFKPSKSKRRWLRLILFILLVLLLLLGIASFFTFKTVKEQAESGLKHVQNVQEQLKAANDSDLNRGFVTWLGNELNAAEQDFKSARQSLGFFTPLLPLAENLPGPGYDVSKLPDFLSLAERTARLSKLALQGAQSALGYFDNTVSSESTGISAKLLQAAQALATPEARANFTEASDLYEELEAASKNIDRRRLSLEQTRKGFEQFDQQLPALKKGLALATQLPPVLPDALGKDRAATYLVLIQNSDELRPTGGFVSAVGLVTVNQGKLTLSGFQDSYAVDNPKVVPETAPEPLVRYMNASYLLLRDANWWPDFPTSARQIMNLYREHQGKSVDGVIALDSRAVSYLFQALGPLELPAYQERLTARNFEERLRYYYLPPGTAQNGDWWLKRKDFIGVVMNGLLARLNGASAREYFSVAEWLGQAATEKHLQFYFNRPELENQLTRLNLDGAQPVKLENSDYLMVVDANVGFNKVNANIEKSQSYSVVGAGSGASLFASLTLTYTNRAGVRDGTKAGECQKVVKYDSNYASMMNGCYWDYLRVYVPGGSLLQKAEGFAADNYPATTNENGFTVFASQVIVPPGQTLTLTFNYVLPNQLSDLTNYRLLVQKQAGLSAIPLTLQLNLAGVMQNRQLDLDQDLKFEFNRLLGLKSSKF